MKTTYPYRILVVVIPVFFLTQFVDPIIQLYILSPIGSQRVIGPALFAIPGTMLFGAAICWVSALFIEGKSNIRLVVLCVPFLSCVLFIPSRSLAQQIRHNAFATLASRSTPLIAAIDQYQRDSKKLPRTLQELVPKYLAEVPTTHMGAYPKYEYEPHEDGLCYSVLVSTPNIGLNIDEFRYESCGKYPEYGKYWEPIGEWKYYHE